MSVYAPPTITVGSPVTASGFDGLLRAADERLERLFSGSRSWYVFDTSSVPDHQVPPYGAVYVLSDDADRDLIPAPGSSGCPHGGNWPAKYDHAAHIAAVESLTITGADSENVAWEVTGSFAVDVYSFGDSASILERNNGGEVRPVKFSGAFEPERFHRYAVADVFIESASKTNFDWHFDKYGVVRFHNISQFQVSIDLGNGQTVSVEEERVRVIRRTSRTGTWDLTLRRYFPRCLPRDIPMWDSDTSSMFCLPLRSQSANPIFRQAFLQEMFQPWALTDDPGMFSATILPVLPEVDPDATLAAAIVQNGAMECIRTSTGDPDVLDRVTLLYSGETLSGTPPEWADFGLTVSLDDATRGAVIEPDPAFPPPTIGAWHFDLISRSTNITGGIIVEVFGSTETERVLLPWFADATAADAWYLAIFIWPEYEVTRVQTSSYWSTGTWTATGGGLDTDYFGSWSEDASTEVREWEVTWNGKTFGSVSAWNVFTKVISDAVPSGGELIRQPILTAVTTTSTVEFFAERDSGTWDDANSVQIRPTDGMRGIDVAGDPWGLGTVDSDSISEPRWQYALFPTIGNDPLSSFKAYPFYGTEPIIWTPLVPSGVGLGNLYHWRTTSPEGAAEGAAWGWDYEGTHTPAGLEPSTGVDSGMTFWRMFDQNTLPPGSAERYQGKVETGPQPWVIRDHGWLADEVLAGGAVAAGDTWYQAKLELYDYVDITGSSSSRPDEALVGFQIRMVAMAFNQLSALIAGMSHVRPCGWEQYLRGFSFNDLVGTGGWNPLGVSTEPYVQPFGAVHVYGVDGTMDAKLSDLGISPRAFTSTELQSLQSVTMREYYVYTPGFTPLWMDDQSVSRPSNWTSIGDEIEYITANDLHDALSLRGFAFNQARFVQPIRIETMVPGTGIETKVDEFEGTLPINTRARIQSTTCVLVPEDADVAELQISTVGNFRISPERPIRAQIIARFQSSGPTVLAVMRVGDATGEITDSLDRFFGEFDVTGYGPPLNFLGGVTSRSRFTWWAGTLLCRTGLAVKVLASPMRELLSFDRTTDETGNRSVTDDEWNSEVGLPNDTARPQWLEVTNGDTITVGMLAGGSLTYPDDYHVWQLCPLDGSIEVM